MHPVAITERAVIGNQIRVPSAACEVAGCWSVFTDHAALGEADNRARALVAGWAGDAFGRLACPSCQQRYSLTPAQAARSTGAAPAGERATAGGALPTGSMLSSSMGSIVAQCHDSLSRGWYRGAQWVALLAALASQSNGWTAPQPVAMRRQLTEPGNDGDTAVGEGISRHAGRHRRWPGDTDDFAGQPGA